jgi:protein AFG1
MSRDEIDTALDDAAKVGHEKAKEHRDDEHSDVESSMRSLMDDLGMNMNMLKSTSFFSGDEEAFAFARALSRLSEMGSQEWVERGMGLESKGGKKEVDDYMKMRSSRMMDSYG